MPKSILKRSTFAKSCSGVTSGGEGSPIIARQADDVMMSTTTEREEAENDRPDSHRRHEITLHYEKRHPESPEVLLVDTKKEGHYHDKENITTSSSNAVRKKTEHINSLLRRQERAVKFNLSMETFESHSVPVAVVELQDTDLNTSNSVTTQLPLHTITNELSASESNDSVLKNRPNVNRINYKVSSDNDITNNNQNFTYNDIPTPGLIDAIHQLREELTKSQINFTAEKALRKRSERNLVKLAKRLSIMKCDVRQREEHIAQLIATTNQKKLQDHNVEREISQKSTSGWISYNDSQESRDDPLKPSELIISSSGNDNNCRDGISSTAAAAVVDHGVKNDGDRSAMIIGELLQFLCTSKIECDQLRKRLAHYETADEKSGYNNDWMGRNVMASPPLPVVRWKKQLVQQRKADLWDLFSMLKWPSWQTRKMIVRINLALMTSVIVVVIVISLGHGVNGLLKRMLY